MKCQSCGAYVERGDLCFDCRRDEIQYEREQLRIAADEEFHRKLVQDQIENQRIGFRDQASNLDFRESRRMLLGIEMEALTDFASAKGKAFVFFTGRIFREHFVSLLETIAASEFLLECYCAHELQRMCDRHQDPAGEEIDWLLDFQANSSLPPLKKVHAKLVAMAEACDAEAAGLQSALIEKIRTHASRREADQKQREEEERLKLEAFDRAYQQMLQLAQIPSPSNASASSWIHAAIFWFVHTISITPAQREASRQFWERRRQRRKAIDLLAEWIDQGERIFWSDSTYPNREMCVMAQLWFESPFDKRLVVLVMVHLLRNHWRIRPALAAAYDEFLKLESRCE